MILPAARKVNPFLLSISSLTLIPTSTGSFPANIPTTETCYILLQTVPTHYKLLFHCTKLDSMLRKCLNVLKCKH